ncbi:hypothetical protein J8273_6239 [Carpediemonas membranifera]|uniref:CysZ protein n=1 Tax=Carpediemonas membranifera TaxID=201153 RepID=A0A8J6DY39_9EUKA|nr:hypothetical protein J8273_6239 [Carpediemonas membranifera]|eukprot:KAG9391479.1 hypothetical protein J8273_6239 [Carpediemonas membranifera]
MNTAYATTDGDTGIPFRLETDRKITEADITTFQLSIEDITDCGKALIAPSPGIVTYLAAYGAQYGVIAGFVALAVVGLLLNAAVDWFLNAISFPSLLLLWRIILVLVFLVATIALGAVFMILNGTAHLSLIRCLRGERVPLGKDWFLPPTEFIPHFLYYQTAVFVVAILPFIIIFPLIWVIPILLCFINGSFMYLMAGQPTLGLFAVVKLSVMGGLRNWQMMLIVCGINLAGFFISQFIPVVYIVVVPFTSLVGLVYASKMFGGYLSQ